MHINRRENYTYKKKEYEPYSALVVEYSSANATVRQDIYISPNRECILPQPVLIFPVFAVCTLLFVFIAGFVCLHSYAVCHLSIGLAGSHEVGL
jgi:hypothetical protein